MEAKKDPSKIQFRFCRECSNLLYPKEDKIKNDLIYACRTCHYSDDSESSLVYATDHSAGAGETAGITQDVGSDPTLPRSNKSCPRCSTQNAVFFQSQERKADTGMKLYYVCTNCGFLWATGKKRDDS